MFYHPLEKSPHIITCSAIFAQKVPAKCPGLEDQMRIDSDDFGSKWNSSSAFPPFPTWPSDTGIPKLHRVVDIDEHWEQCDEMILKC